MRVERYDLFLDIDFSNLKFLGKVLVAIDSEDDVLLNSKSLNILELRGNGRKPSTDDITTILPHRNS